MRILLYLATNIAVLALLSMVFSLLGLQDILAQNGVNLDLGGLLVFCALFGFGGSLISLLLSKWMALRSTGTQVIEQANDAEEQWLLETVDELAQKAGIGMPTVGVFPSDTANAFATGWQKNDALVAVSSGLLQRFGRPEVRAVLAHEIGHVANGDMVTLSLIQGVINTFVMFTARVVGHTIDRVVFKNERGYGMGYFAVTMVTELLLGFLASMIVCWFSRWREYRADAAGANLTSVRDMAGALRRLQREQGLPQELPGELTAFGITEQFKQGFAALFRTHPPLEHRINALESNYR